MDGFYVEAGFLQAPGHFFGHHHAAVLSAGASEADGQVAFAFGDVVGQQKQHHVGELGEELAGLRKFADE